MNIKEIDEFAEVRVKARAYFCYILSRALPNRVPNITLSDLKVGLKSISKTLKNVDAMFILDAKGEQVINTISMDPKYARKGMGSNRSARAYYYKVIRDKRCILTEPYPSIKSNNLIVTVAHPIYNEKGELEYIVCVDIALSNVLRMVNPSSIDALSGKSIRFIYALFTLALGFVALVLFVKGVVSFFSMGVHIENIDIKHIFESTILLTLSLAIFDLVKAMLDEEVLGKNKKDHESDIHKTMVRFLGSIIIALSIEALMLVFKFALIDLSKLLYAVYLILAITALLIGLSIYIKSLKEKPKG
ncbi:MAG TPA: hypothetical protein ENL00_03820 [Nitratifractor sp.]|jgi:hypothetical protein|nr:hypothetical protein [Nitratifractor sp.]HHD74930.1 hypothetical protein [Nitratifractor sp.]